MQVWPASKKNSSLGIATLLGIAPLVWFNDWLQIPKSPSAETNKVVEKRKVDGIQRDWGLKTCMSLVDISLCELFLNLFRNFIYMIEICKTSKKMFKK